MNIHFAASVAIVTGHARAPRPKWHLMTPSENTILDLVIYENKIGDGDAF